MYLTLQDTSGIINKYSWKLVDTIKKLGNAGGRGGRGGRGGVLRQCIQGHSNVRLTGVTIPYFCTEVTKAFLIQLVEELFGKGTQRSERCIK